METILVERREPSIEEAEKHSAEVVFIREDADGKQYTIYGCVCHESWEQWGEAAHILGDNVEDIDDWRSEIEDEPVRTFSSNGMIWNDGDIPKCNYCSKDIDEVYSLHETPYSGELCCDDDDCRETLLETILSEEVTED